MCIRQLPVHVATDLKIFLSQRVKFLKGRQLLWKSIKFTLVTIKQMTSVIHRIIFLESYSPNENEWMDQLPHVDYISPHLFKIGRKKV